MSVKPQYETYRYTGEVAKLRSQSMVECRLSGSEIGSILVVKATATPTESVCSDGEVRYKGKAFFCIVYEDGAGKICRAERGVEFYHKAEGSEVTSSCFAKTAFDVVNVTHRREGSGLFITAVVDAVADVYGGKQMEYLVGGEKVVCQPQEITLCKTVCVTGETDGEDEFETDYVGDVILHSENAVVTRMRASGGQLDIEGEIALGICALKGDNSVCFYERLVPFTMQIPCEEAFGRVNPCARVTVKSATITAGVDEDKGKSKMVFDYTLTADCYLSRLDELHLAQDAFSVGYETQFERVKETGRYLTKIQTHTQRVAGTAILLADDEEDYALETATLSRTEIECKNGENGMQAEGVITAEILVKNADGGRRVRTLSLPFTFPIPVDGKFADADGIVVGLTAKRKGKEVEAEATLKLCVRLYDECDWEYIRAYTAGEEKPVCDSAVSIFMTREGESLWQVAKRLCVKPEDLQSANPELQFPVVAGQRIFVYRQIK